jgi:hypothetical protein
MNELVLKVVDLINQHESDAIELKDTSYEKLLDDISVFFYNKQFELVDTYGISLFENLTNIQLSRLYEVINTADLWDHFYEFSYWMSGKVIAEEDLIRGEKILRVNSDFNQTSIYNFSSPYIHRYCEMKNNKGKNILTRTINWRTVQYVLAFFVRNLDLNMSKHYKRNGKPCHCHKYPKWLRAVQRKCAPDGLPRDIPKYKLRQVFGDQKLNPGLQADAIEQKLSGSNNEVPIISRPFNLME